MHNITFGYGTLYKEKIFRLYELIAMPIIIALAAAVRVFGIGQQGVSLDESYSIFYAYSEGWWISIFWDNHPPLYYLALHAWLCFFPLSEVSARLLSVLFSTLGVFLFYEIGRLIGGKRFGLRMALLLCFSAISIQFAREVRIYALFEFLTIAFGLSIYFFIKNPKLSSSLNLGITTFFLVCARKISG